MPSESESPLVESPVEWRKVALAAVGVAAVGTIGYVAYKAITKADKTPDDPVTVEGETTPKSIDTPVSDSSTAKADDESAKKPARGPLTALEHKERGNDFFKREMYEDAIDCYTNALETLNVKTPRDKTAASTFHQNRAAAYEKLERFDKVEEECSSAIKHNPTYTKAYNRRAKANEAIGNMDQALKDLTAACVLEQFAKMTTLNEADRVLKMVAEEKAREMVKARGSQTTVPLSVTFVESYLSSFCEDPILNSLPPRAAQLNGVDQQHSMSGFESAKRCLVEKRYEDVEAACTQELESDGEHRLETLMLRATFALIQGNSALATQDFDSFFEAFDALDQQEKDNHKKLRVNAYIKRGSFHMQQGRKDEALADFKLAEDADIDNADVYHHRGQLHILMGQIDEAQSDFHKCVQQRPDFGVARVQSSYADYRHALKGSSTLDVQKSIEAFERTVDAFPDCAEGFALLGQVYAEREAYQDATQVFDKAIQLQPQNANIYVHKGLLELQRTEDVDAGKKIMQRAIEVDPHCEFAYETMGTIEVQRGNINQAIDYFDRALHLARTELELTHIFGMKEAAMAQRWAATALGFELPQGM